MFGGKAGTMSNRFGLASSKPQAPKSDTLILSEKAKDLAALIAGKPAQEDVRESLGAKMKEGDTDEFLRTGIPQEKQADPRQ